MYAIVSIGGKQYKVKVGSEVKVEKLGLKGKKATLKEVLLISDGSKVEIGSPFVDKARVVCDILREDKAPKVISFKYRRRKNSKTKTGHRQPISVIKVKEIKIGGEKEETAE